MVEPTNHAGPQGPKRQPEVSEKDLKHQADMQGSKSQPEVSEKDPDDGADTQGSKGQPEVSEKGPADGASKETPERPATPNVLFYEDNGGQVHIVAEGDEAVAEHDKSGEKRPDPRPKRPDGKVELTRDLAPECTAYEYPGWKKWYILCVVFLVQVSMNFNTSVYPNATGMIPDDSRFEGVGDQGARASQMIFLVAYAFGSELWAPWSEEIGRWPIMQLSLFLVNITQLWGVYANNYNTLLAARFFGGLFTAGGSVTLGMVADLYDAEDHQFAIAFIVLSSVIGTSCGPIVGGFVQNANGESFNGVRWVFWLMLIFGGFTQLVHGLTVPETLCSTMLDREARRRRAAAKALVNGTDPKKELGLWDRLWYKPPMCKPRKRDVVLYGPHELVKGRFHPKQIGKLWIRPFHMIATEPIVLFLSLLSGFSDALIFTFSMSFDYVYKDGWDFKPWAVGLAFVPINLGYFFGFFSFFPTIIQQRKVRRMDPEALLPEVRLWWLLWVAPLEPIGLFGFAWTSMGNAHGVHWIGTMIFSVMIAIANYAIYMATIDYMVEAYGEYSASATGGNALARDLLAGISAMYAVPMYKNISPSSYSYEWASTFLGFVSILVIAPIYLFYWKGPQIRERSPFAQEILKQVRESRLRRKYPEAHPDDVHEAVEKAENDEHAEQLVQEIA